MYTDKAPRIVTQADLRAYGLSNYMVRRLIKGLIFSTGQHGLRLYATPDVVLAIKSKLSQPRTRPETRGQLHRVLAWLGDESNVIRVDFLKNLSLEERAKVLKARTGTAERNMKAGVLKEYEDVQKRGEAVLAGS
ncbi:MAG: hypothetical protein HC838_03335 [Spirulinaceae cyanobacterium RM2_2_10]|nr:hypothetical protein [Spirulinaceae cyanobacterium SM2_1_0]NJO19287.1 hypothetical protein [Spirulinaceae cyanobacterium RM2_2_10]